MRYNPSKTVELHVDRGREGWRLDRFVTVALNWRSRTSIQECIADGQIKLAGRPAKASSRVRRGDVVTIEPRPDLLPYFDPDSVEYDVLFEDAWLLVINKPPHLVVHPTCSHLADHLMAVLESRYAGMEGPMGPVVPRLAHRIDANTSGALLLTKQEELRSKIAGQFARRRVSKEYHALVHGVPEKPEFEIDGPIGLDPDSPNRVKRAVRAKGLPSLTTVKVLESFGAYSLVCAKPLTGRTHQIRVHLAHAGHPILCDKLYGREEILQFSCGSPEENEILLDRHALHSRRLVFRHPVTEKNVEVTAPYTRDLETTIRRFRKG